MLNRAPRNSKNIVGTAPQSQRPNYMKARQNRDSSSQNRPRVGKGSSPTIANTEVRGAQPRSNSNSQVDLGQFTTAQKNINSAIQEYLLKYGFQNTVATMLDEMTVSRQDKNFIQDEQQAIQYMGQSFNTGTREAFFNLW